MCSCCWQVSARDRNDSAWDGEIYDYRYPAEMKALEWYAQGFKVQVIAPETDDRKGRDRIVLEMVPPVVVDADEVLAEHRRRD